MTLGTKLIETILAGKLRLAQPSKNAIRRLEHTGVDMSPLTRGERGMKDKRWRKKHPGTPADSTRHMRVGPRLDMSYLDRSKYNGDGSKK